MSTSIISLNQNFNTYYVQRGIDDMVQKLNTRILKTQNTTHFRLLNTCIIYNNRDIFFTHVYSLSILLIIYAFDTFF